MRLIVLAAAGMVLAVVLAAGCLQRLVEGTAKPFSVIGLRGCGEEHAVTRRAHDHASPFERTSRQQLEAAHVHSPLARRCRWLASPWSPRRPRRPAACGNVSAIYPPSSLAPAPPALLAEKRREQQREDAAQCMLPAMRAATATAAATAAASATGRHLSRARPWACQANAMASSSSARARDLCARAWASANSMVGPSTEAGYW